jgi:DNA-binding MarR family transcriptional regulator
MSFSDDAVEVRAQGWRTLAAFHDLIDSALEIALQREVGLSAVEYAVLDVLSRQVGVHHLRMQQLARAAALSRSATTRLVNRLESRGLLVRYICVDDRRGIYTELTDTGAQLLTRARPVHDVTLRDALTEAQSRPELSPLVGLIAGPQASPAVDGQG